MIYVVAVLTVACFWAWSLTPVVRVWGGVLFPWYRAIGLAKDRDAFLRFHQWMARVFAGAATAIAVVGVILRASGS